MGTSKIWINSSSNLNIELSLTPSSQAAQMTVSGRGVYDQKAPAVEFRGTYFVKQKRLAAFGEVRGLERSYTLALDGTWMPGSKSFAAKCKLNNVAANLTTASEVFYLHQGSSDQPQVSVDLAPNKTSPGQLVTGRGSIEVSRAKGPIRLRVRGGISFAATQQTAYRWPSATILTLDAPGNGRVGFDIGGLGLTLPAGVDDPKLVVDVMTPNSTVSQAAPLEHDEADASAHFEAVIPRVFGAAVGKPIDFRVAYRVRNRSTNPLNSLISERVWVSRDGESKTELPHQTWQADVVPGGMLHRDVEDPQKFQFIPDSPGRYRIDFQLQGIGVTGHTGFTTIDVTGTPSRQQEPKGDLRGSIQFDRGSTTASDPVNVTLSYSLSGRSSAEVDESVELIGPSGSVVASSNKQRSLMKGEAEARRWVVNAAEPGAYRLKAKVSGPDVTPLETEAALTVKPKEKEGGTAGGETKPPKVEGTYGLVKIEPGFAPTDGQGPYGYWTGNYSGTSFQCTWTATRDYQGTYSYKCDFSSPPSVLKPGEEIELTTTSSASRTSENQPYHGSGSKWYVEGAEVLEAVGAFSGSASDGKFYSSGKGKTRFKVGSGGTIKLIAGQGQGIGNNQRAPIFIYQWNSPPIVDTGGTDEKDEPIVNTKTGLYPVGDDDQEEGPLRAFLQPTSITLRAGEMSEIVNVHISNFRKRTEDRVEVIFPEKTDNWASLPGGIVVMQGDGSYWPPNMGRPEHVDGYFFRARSTALSSKQSVTIIVRQRKAGEVRLTLDVTVIGKGSSGPPPSGASWAGAWSSNFDDMVLTQEGDKVSGWFGVDRYKVSGTVVGRVFTFKISDGKDEFGSGKLTLSEDGKSFEGTLTVAGNDPMEWKGRRVGGPLVGSGLPFFTWP